jgi:hypothetical protein
MISSSTYSFPAVLAHSGRYSFDHDSRTFAVEHDRRGSRPCLSILTDHTSHRRFLLLKSVSHSSGSGW